MRKIKTIDDITKDGKVEFGEGYEFVGTAEEADAILMRSTDLHGYELPEGIRAIARCGAGVNNIPVEEYAKRGVVVFNSPGANSNAVKELVLGMLVLSSRGVVQSMNWVRDNADDPTFAYGKQRYKRGGMWYTAQSGIWQSVWMEWVPEPRRPLWAASSRASASASSAWATWAPRSPTPASTWAWTSTATIRSFPSNTHGC